MIMQSSAVDWGGSSEDDDDKWMGNEQPADLKVDAIGATADLHSDWSSQTSCRQAITKTLWLWKRRGYERSELKCNLMSKLPIFKSRSL
jgi:hypothetical protein